jgi:maltose O-acetyltransferase
MSKITQIFREEFGTIHARYLVTQFFVSLLPHNSMSRIRTAFYRFAGLNIGRGALIFGKLTLTGHSNFAKTLTIGASSRINTPLYIELNADVTIGENVAIGHHVVIITTDHETSNSKSRSGATVSSPISIEDGAWIGAGATLLPGVIIGAGAVVAAGSLVSQSVLPHKVVGGVPARIVKTLEG